MDTCSQRRQSPHQSKSSKFLCIQHRGTWHLQRNPQATTLAFEDWPRFFLRADGKSRGTNGSGYCASATLLTALHCERPVLPYSTVVDALLTPATAVSPSALSSSTAIIHSSTYVTARPWNCLLDEVRSQTRLCCQGSPCFSLSCLSLLFPTRHVAASVHPYT